MNLVTKTLHTFILALLVSQAVYAEDKQWKESYLLEAKAKYQQAEDKMQQLANKDGRNEFVQLRLAWLNYLQANYNDSKDYYKKALRINPNSLDARLGIVKPLLAQQRWLEAEKYNTKVLKNAPLNITANLNQFAIDEHNKQWNKLKKHTSYFVSRFPSNTSALVYLARSYAWLKNKSKAKKVYNQVLQRYTTNLEAKYYLKNN